MIKENKDILKYLSRENEYTNAWYKANGTLVRYLNITKNLCQKSFKTNLDGYKYFSTESLSLNIQNIIEFLKIKN